MGGLAAAGLGPGAAIAEPSALLTYGPARAFSFDRLKQHARAVAHSPYIAPQVNEADILHAIDYDAYGQIVYRPQMALWANTPGAQAVRFFPLGRYFKEPVRIFVVENGLARELLYRPELFDIPSGNPALRLKTGGFAGFRLMNGASDTDWMAFLGASYFRSSGPFDQYGASARGLAIDSGLSTPEEFPRFSAFWLEQISGGALRVYALLESPSVTGAFRIDNRRTDRGPVQEIETELNVRKPVNTLGLAPLTSMYWYGQNSPRQDWRPQIHDSDGLALWTGKGERIWRPLNDPKTPALNSFLDDNPKGFGLIQRDRAFSDYEDDSVFYEKRPSLWVEPLSPLGQGSVRLLELPTADETNDNIVAFWTPAQPVKSGDVISARYRLNWAADAPASGDIGRIVATRLGRGGRPGVEPRPRAIKFVVDVEGAALAGLDRSSGVDAVVSASQGTIDTVAAYPVAGTKLWRMMFDLTAPVDQTVDLRAYLRRSGQALSETWLYQIRP
jgi:glucans biosynthesis protein